MEKPKFTVLVIPFVDIAKDKKEADVSGTMATTLPMAAVRNFLYFRSSFTKFQLDVYEEQVRSLKFDVDKLNFTTG